MLTSSSTDEGDSPSQNPPSNRRALRKPRGSVVGRRDHPPLLLYDRRPPATVGPPDRTGWSLLGIPPDGPSVGVRVSGGGGLCPLVPRTDPRRGRAACTRSDSPPRCCRLSHLKRGELARQPRDPGGPLVRLSCGAGATATLSNARGDCAAAQPVVQWRCWRGQPLTPPLSSGHGETR